MGAVTTAWRSRIVDQGVEDPRALVANPRNWRTHPSHQRDALAGLLAEVGWVQQVVVNRTTGHLVDGHLRVELAAGRDEPEIPVLYVGLEPAEEAIVLASLDPTAGLAGVDRDRLASLLSGVEPESADVRKLLADLARDAGLDTVTDGLTEEDEPGPETEPYVEVGQTWRLGDHRLVVGDATDADVITALVPDAEVDIVWTDPPYGVDYRPERIGRKGPTGIANDALDLEALRSFLETALGNAKAVLRPGGPIYVASPGRRQGVVFVDVLAALDLYHQTLIWVKDVFVMGRSDYQWRHELLHLGVKPGQGTKASSPVHYGWKPGAAHHFVPDRDLDTVWEIPRPKASAEHPTMKPVELVRRCLAYSSRRGDIVLDPFLGSGSTLIAAETIGRRCLGVELDPRYAQAAIERWQAFTGQEAQRG